VSLFSIHVPEPSERTKWPVCSEIFPVIGPRSGQMFASKRSETAGNSSPVSE
jgi:hypothetical protein